jgi:hypothetical protein
VDVRAVAGEGGWASSGGGGELDELGGRVDFADLPAPSGEYQEPAGHDRRARGEGPEGVSVGEEPVFGGGVEGGEEAVVVDQLLALAAVQEKAVAFLAE